MTRNGWVLLIALVALVAILVWWLRKKAAASPTGTVTIGPLTVTNWNPPPSPPPILSTVAPEVAASTGDLSYLGPSAISTVTFAPPVSKGLDFNQGPNGILLL
jgi:hypothetical protein